MHRRTLATILFALFAVAAVGLSAYHIAGDRLLRWLVGHDGAAALIPSRDRDPDAVAAPQGDLLYVHGGSVWRGGEAGQEPVEVVRLPQMEGWSLRGTRLVVLLKGLGYVVDLADGHQALLSLPLDSPMAQVQALWAESGDMLVHAALMADPSAPTFGHRADLRVVDTASGSVTARFALHDSADITLLRYDATRGEVVLARHGADDGRARVERYEVETGALLGSISVLSVGPLALSPDGRYLLTIGVAAQGHELLVYDLEGEDPSAPLFWECPAGTYPASYAWAPSGQRVAYLLRVSEDTPESLGQPADPAAEPPEDGASGVGGTVTSSIWVLDVTEGTTYRINDEPGVRSAIVGWTPDSATIAVRHEGTANPLSSETATYHYLVRPDGGGMRILSVEGNATLLGWLPAALGAIHARVQVDPWMARFAQASGDPADTAQAVAEYLTEKAGQDDEILTEELRGYLQSAGWSLGLTEPQVKRLAEGTYIAQLPPMALYVVESGTAHAAGHGNVLLDARLEQDRLGLIYGAISASAVQPTYVLLGRDPAARWMPVWTPQGRRDWITTDGHIEFLDEGIERLRVTGTSFGLDDALSSPFAECHPCVHRTLIGEWVRSEDAYVRVSAVGPAARLPDQLWEMTLRTPYAILHEVVRRIRAGEDAQLLVAGSRTLQALQALGLDDADARLLPEEETDRQVLFTDARTGRRYRAAVSEGKITALEPLAP